MSPFRAPTICRDCRRVAVSGGYCQDHQHDNRAKRRERERQQAKRASGFKALYDSKQWCLVTRPSVLARDPLCKLEILCEGKSPSTEVDHIIRAEVYVAMHDGDLWSFYDDENLRGCLRDWETFCGIESCKDYKRPTRHAR